MKRESGGEDEMKDGENPNLEEAIVGFLLWSFYHLILSHFIIFSFSFHSQRYFIWPSFERIIRKTN